MQWEFFLKNIDNDSLTIYTAKDNFVNDEIYNPILFVSHELSCTGAPIALLNMAKILRSENRTVFLLCDKDGDLRLEFLKFGVNVIIYPMYNADESWIQALSICFEHVVVNTLSLINTIVVFFRQFKKIFWWIHESEYMFEDVNAQVYKLLGISLYSMSKNNFLNVVFGAVSPLVAASIHKYFGAKAYILPYCVPDDKISSSVAGSNNRISFLQIGSVNANKRADLLIDAALKLPDELFQKCNFTFVGNKNNANPEILNRLSEFAQLFFNVRFLPAMPQGDIYKLYDMSDVVVITSMQETVSSVAVEACMKQKLCICSDTAGITKYMKDGDEMLLFPAGDVNKLYEKILYAINNYDSLDSVRKKGRNIYEMYFSETVFKDNVKTLFSDLYDNLPETRIEC